ncbi:MAG: hypothetical protein LBC84_03315 [Prevotellaceae bacterium]|jgi:acyl-ACP thioesterase|nr:hypothetical protein [Prevotellaceae bacterium]
MNTQPTQPFYSRSFSPLGQDVDQNKRLRLTRFLQKTQEAAEAHADLYQCGYHHLITQNIVWVLSRMRLHIVRMPQWEEPVQLQTWHKRVERIFSLRDFILFDAHNRPIITATSAWLLMDTHTRRMLRVENVLPYLANIRIEQEAITQVPDKLTPPNNTPLLLDQTHRVVYSDLDLINHVTNTKYVEWTLDALPFEAINTQTITTLQINFNVEARHNDCVELWHASPNANTHYVEGRRGDQNLFGCLCEMG